MSTFNAVNLSPQDEQFEAEEHSRELQVEESFKIFQLALRYLNDKKFESSDEKFRELFSMDVVKPDKWGVYRYSSPTIDRLRYLAYRNRGMYYYSYIVENYHSMTSSDIVNDILKVVENLLESIQHCDADTTVTALLVQIFRSFKSKKLERLMLEYELSKKENHLLLHNRRKVGILPHLRNTISQYNSILSKIDDRSTLGCILPCSNLKGKAFNSLANFGPVLSKIHDLKTEDESTMKQLDLYEIVLEEMTWESLLQSLKNAMPYTKASTLFGRNSDPYGEIEEPMEGIKFVIEKKDIKEVAKEGGKINTSKEDTSANKIKDLNDMALQSDDTKTVKRSIDDTDQQRPAHRSSKRFKERDSSESSLDAFQTHKRFFADITELLNLLEYSLPLSLEDYNIDHFRDDSSLIMYNDFFDCLISWNTWHTEIFSQYENKKNSKSTGGIEEVLQLNSLLKSNIMEEKDSINFKVEELPNIYVHELIDELNRKTPHFHEVRFLIVFHLLEYREKSRLIIKYKWSPQLYKIFTWLLLGIESSLYEFISTNLSDYWSVGLSILEILVDTVGGICEEISSKKIQGNRASDLRTQRNKLEKKIVNWENLLKSASQPGMADGLIQFKWISYCLLQFTSDITDKRLTESLTEILMMLSNCKLNITYPNYMHIPSLNKIAVNSQLRKINMIKSITLVNIPDDEDKKDREESDTDHIKLLNSVLHQSLYPQPEMNVDKEIVSFINSSPFLLKVNLWNVLFSHYINMGIDDSVLQTYFSLLHLLTTELFNEDIKNEKPETRKLLLLTILSSVGHFSTRLLDYLQLRKWKLNLPENKQSFQQELINIFFLIYFVLYFESSVTTESSTKSFFKRATKSSGIMKEYISDLATLIMYFCNIECSKKIPSDVSSLTTEMIACFHSLLGDFSFCDVSKGHFLLLSEELLCRYVNNDSYRQLKQILWCRYHFTVSGDINSTLQHETKASKMDKGNSVPLGTYLMKLEYQNKNPLLAGGNKSSLKQVLDSVIETVGDPSMTNNHIIERNKYILDEYLTSPISIVLFKNAFKGTNKIVFTSPNDELQNGMNAGIFYTSSIQSIHMYRIRKKSMQARPSELDSIIRTLRNDILYNTNRFESWYLLGKCFSYIVEDDLIWTSDKLTVTEKKNTTALTQRKAILCYLMAITIFYSKNSRSTEEMKILQMTLENLGSELLSGYYKPMDKLCFHWKRSDNILKISDDGVVSEEKAKEIMTISGFNIEQAILKCFNLANTLMYSQSFKENAYSETWVYHYCVGKTLFKIDKTCYGESAVRNMERACVIASSLLNSKDSIIEPHYSLINMCYKLSKQKVISRSKALEIIRNDNSFLNQADEFWKVDKEELTDEVYYMKIIDLLRSLISLDKKKCHHRPTYRIAKILFEDLKKTKEALEEMDNLVSLKNSKNLVNIWKPDFERPGKHFVYTYQYVVFYVSLLVELRSYNSIASVIKKIRRFGSGMAYVNEATDFTIKSYVNSFNRSVDIDDRHIEQLLPSLNYQTFLKVSEQLYNNFDTTKYAEEHLTGLKLAFQLKKGNNGIAFDGVCLSLYFLKFYLPLLRETESSMDKTSPNVTHTTVEPSSTISPSTSVPAAAVKTPASRKRVSKKEAFDRIKALVEKIP